jgi:hypothetical protein
VEERIENDNRRFHPFPVFFCVPSPTPGIHPNLPNFDPTSDPQQNTKVATESSELEEKTFMTRLV